VGESDVTAYAHPLGDGQRESASLAVRPTKLKPALTRSRAAPARLTELLAPRPGCLLLVHAAAGYGKTTALAMTQPSESLWYNLDRSDHQAQVLAGRLCVALGVAPPPADAPASGEALALEMADDLQGRELTITFDRFEQLGDAPEVGRLLSELLLVVPGLSVRLATRTRPTLPLERMRLEGRLFEVGPAELRLDHDEIECLLAAALDREPRQAEMDFADGLLGGWPAAVHLWVAGLDGSTDVLAPLQPGKPLHDYLHEELLEGTLNEDNMVHLRTDLAWLVGNGPIRERASTPDRRWTMDMLVRDRVGVLPGRGGWHLHPLVSAFVEMHATVQPATTNVLPIDAEPEPAGGARQVAIGALGGLSVTIGDLQVPEAAWPAAARRLLELLLCLPGYQATAQQAARLLWPRHLPRSALNSFNVALHGLRRMLQPDLTAGADSRCVIRQGRVYRLHLEQMTCDVDEFTRLVRHATRPLGDEAAERLETAVALYRGDFLAASGEEFTQEKRTRLRRVMLDTLERLGEWHAEAGRAPQALRAYNRLLELAPHREDAWARVLELHVGAGDEYRALAALQQCEQSLESAGIEPSGLLRELHQRIRREAPIERRYGTTA
jgi:DNA-binding SARP family transcriptional activator